MAMTYILYLLCSFLFNLWLQHEVMYIDAVEFGNDVVFGFMNLINQLLKLNLRNDINLRENFKFQPFSYLHSVQ